MVHHRLLACLTLGVASLATTGALADCQFTPPLATQTKCLKAIHIPGNPLQSFDISFVNQDRGEYYFADRSNSGIQVIDTHNLKWKRTLGGFVGAKLNANGTVNNNISGPDGVTSHGRWVYGGDGDSTLKVFDLEAAPQHALKQTISTGGATRVDEMALTTDGRLLLAANNAEDPPFATLFKANGDEDESHVSIITKITVDTAIIPANFGLSLEQPSWDPTTKRFYTSIPIIANNPAGCNANTNVPPVTCHGGLLVTDPTAANNTPAGLFNPATKTGVIALNNCGPNGSTVGPHDNLLLGCTPQNNPSDVITLVINATTRVQTPVVHITGSDEVWFNAGDNRYYTASNRDCATPGTACPTAATQKAALGVIDAATNLLIEKVPQGSGSHSVAADSKRNLIFVPQAAPVAAVIGGDTTPVGAGICGTANDKTGTGCVAVFQHKVKGQDDDDDRDDDRDGHGDR